MLEFEWDLQKDAINRKKHGVAFNEAETCFFDPMHILLKDPDHSDKEERFVLIGMSFRSRILVVIHMDRRGELIRLISAQKRPNRNDASMKRCNYEKRV